MGLEHLDTILAFSVVMLLLSLVITMVVQAVVALLGIRGRNLKWGIERVLERSLGDHAKEVAEKVVSHTAIASPFGGKATAIGSDELLTIVRDLAKNGDSGIEEDAKQLIAKHYGELVPPETRAVVEGLLEQVTEKFPAEEDKAKEMWAKVQGKASKLSADFSQWFDTVMNRTTDRFVLYTRIISIGAALLLAVGLQLDALDMLKDLSADAELRTKLVQSADATVARAQTQLLRKTIPVETLEAVQADRGGFDSATIPPGLETREQGALWIQGAVGPDADVATFVDAYETKFDELTRARLSTLATEVQGLHADLEKSKLVVLPRNMEEYRSRLRSMGSHLLGIIITVLLLSLGAPFWFNALRTVATLRPVLAGTTDPSKRDGRQT